MSYLQMFIEKKANKLWDQQKILSKIYFLKVNSLNNMQNLTNYT